YLHGAGRANTASGDGSLSKSGPPSGAADEPPDHYAYDPHRPVVVENFEKMGPYDHSKRQARQDGLVYSTGPLAEDVEDAGPIRVPLWVGSSAAATALAVMTRGSHPNGRASNLAANEAGFLRARSRKSEPSPERLTPNEPVELVIDQMVTSNVFKA